MQLWEMQGNEIEGTENPRVHSSIPGLGTIKIKDLRHIGASPFLLTSQFGTITWHSTGLIVSNDQWSFGKGLPIRMM